MLKITKLKEKQPVYDITVEKNHNFYANGVLVHNCAEISLPTKPLKSIDDGATRRRIRVPKDKIEEYKDYRKKIGDILYLDKEKFNGKKGTQ